MSELKSTLTRTVNTLKKQENAKALLAAFSLSVIEELEAQVKRANELQAKLDAPPF